jgi:hypothetical protein
VNINIEIRDLASGQLASIRAALQNRRVIHEAMGTGVAKSLREHFDRRNKTRNKKKWPRQNFWARVSASTSMLSADDTGATVAIADPAIRQKIHGGPITPKEGHKYLVIPAIAAAYGRSPLQRDDLAPMIRRVGGRPRAVALVQRAQSDTRTRAETGGTVWYWLVKSVTQLPDPAALPADAVLRRAATAAAKDAVAALVARAAPRAA